jgi:hypothetical protein
LNLFIVQSLSRRHGEGLQSVVEQPIAKQRATDYPKQADPQVNQAFAPKLNPALIGSIFSAHQK